MWRKCVSVILVIAIFTAIISTSYAAEVMSETITEEMDVARASVDATIIDSILPDGDELSVDSSSLQTGLTVDEIDQELSLIYIQLDEALKELKVDRCEENLIKVAELSARIKQLESDMEKYGFTFLSETDVEQLMGASMAEPSAVPDPPSITDTKNARFAVSPVYTATLSSGEKIPYYYVTAYNKNTSSNLVSMPSIPINKNRMSDFLDAFIKTYVAKIVSSAVSAYSMVLNWAPYEMITYSSVTQASATYTVEAVYTSTARFIWAYSEYAGQYYHEATVHRTNIANHHVIRYSANGKSQIDSADENYTVSTDHYSSPGQLVKERWENDIASIEVERVANVKYYYQKDSKSAKELVQSVAVPYVSFYIELT